MGGSLVTTAGIRRICLLTVMLAAFLLYAGCSREPASSGPRYSSKPGGTEHAVYHFAVHPLHNPAKLTQAYQPLIDYLNRHIKKGTITLEASRDYATFEQKYRARKPEFLLPNPWQTLQAMKSGYHVIAMAGDPKDFKGIFLVRIDSGIKVPADLKGKAVSYPSPTALAACIMPQYFLHTHGVNVISDIENRYVGSPESFIMNVYLGKTAAGATSPTPWRAFQKAHPEKAAKLRVAWETETLLNNSVMARGDLPESLLNQVRRLLLQLHGTEEGRKILAGIEMTRFFPAKDQDYELVREYIARFEQEVRPVGKR